MKVTIRVQPKSSQNKLVREKEDVWKVYLTAAPTDNQANKALINFLAKELSLPKSHIVIISGHTSKNKVVTLS